MIFNGKELEPGDWLNMGYGFRRYDFYALKVGEDFVRMSTASWLVSSAKHFSLSDLMSSLHGAKYSGHTERRWWWRFSPFKDLTCPFKPIDF